MARYCISTKAQKEEWALNNAYCKRIANPKPANPSRINGHTIVNGVAIPNGWKPDENPDYSHCRGEFPRVYRTRNYSNDRGYFPRKVKQDVSVECPVEVVSPLQPGGPETAPTEQPVRAGVPEGARVRGGSHRVERVPGISPKASDRQAAGGNGSRMASPFQASRDKLNGETVIYKTPAIPVDLYSREPREIIRWHLERAFHDIGYWEAWAIGREIALPYGFKLERDGCDARVYAMVKDKPSDKYRHGTRPVTVGMLTSKGWVLLGKSQLDLALDRLEKARKKYKLTDPNPTPPRPRNPASNPVRKAAA